MRKKTKTKKQEAGVPLAVYNKLRARFDAAQTTLNNARHWEGADFLSADNEASPSVRATLRVRSRYEIANNSYAEGLVQMLANDTVGTGPRLQMLFDDDRLNDLVERDFAEWAIADRLPQKLRLMRRARCQDGETFAILATNPKLASIVKLKVEVIEADRVQSETPFVVGSNDVVDGIRFDRWGNPVEYSVLRYHPGDGTSAIYDEYDNVSARHMIHSFIARRPGLHRGIPELTAALPLFAYLRRYTLATLSAAEVAADFAAILYTDAPPDGETQPLAPLDPIQLERNMMLTMPAGWKMAQLDSKHPTSTHFDFVKSILSEIARCVCSTYGSVSGDFSNHSYASGRLDAQLYQKSILVDRSVWESEVLDRILEAWLREWQLVNGVFFDKAPHMWFWDGFAHVDPTKEANAQDTHLRNRTTTYAAEYARQGLDWRMELRQIAKEQEYMRQLRITEALNAAKVGKEDDDE